MAKARGVEARLDRLRRLRTEVLGPEQRAELGQALLDKSNLVAAEAAEIAGARMATDLAPDLVAAFGRFMSDPEETDKRCAAKIAIVEARRAGAAAAIALGQQVSALQRSRVQP